MARSLRTAPRLAALASRPAVLDALGFFLLVEVIGLAAVPLAGLAFGRLPGAGLGFAKPLGLLLVTWVVWMAASVTPIRVRHRDRARGRRSARPRRRPGRGAPAHARGAG